MTNGFVAACCYCGERVDPNKGKMWKQHKKWLVSHKDCSLADRISFLSKKHYVDKEQCIENLIVDFLLESNYIDIYSGYVRKETPEKWIMSRYDRFEKFANKYLSNPFNTKFSTTAY